MNIEELTLKQIREIQAIGVTPAPAVDKSAWKIGKIYLIRTVTMINVGRLVDVTAQELVLEDAAWIADTGRFSEMMAGEIEPNEVEPFPDGRVIIGRGALIDAAEYGKTHRVKK